MAVKKKKYTKKTTKPKDTTYKTILGVTLTTISVLVFLMLTSYLYNWKFDQSQIGTFDREVIAKNIIGKLGAEVGHLMIYKSFGLASFLFPFILLVLGVWFLLKHKVMNFRKLISIGLFILLWVPLFFAFAFDNDILGGMIGFEIDSFLNIFIGKIGTGIIIGLSFLIFLALQFGITPDKIEFYFGKMTVFLNSIFGKILSAKDKIKTPEFIKNKSLNPLSNSEDSTDKMPKIAKAISEELTLDTGIAKKEVNIIKPKSKETPKEGAELEIKIEKPKEEKLIFDNKPNELVKKYGEYDHREDLSSYQFPTLDLLKEYENSNISVNQEELEQNKNKIVETLGNYKIQISKIKATIGPTVTLYEIIPAPGVRISKIKNLEDDIALSLAALGIRIIAPIPGKGTIGIEVPNSSPSIVSMKSSIASEKFQTSKMELPIAIGKTISNQTLVIDLAKMPHLLMAGATGQGKSVGLNAIITSLLYKKHPSEVKFVLIDPKKVELTLYNKIERHFLAKLPDSNEAIITDNTKVINTLNSLCIEMDNRYELLQKAMVRNIKEYNVKFKARKLNPEKGHRYLPYIVLIVDEFADLIITAGKEVETPIARLAQLARAIGIHLIVATQRPSVNVITGIIKANFPARIAFRVTSKIDSRTILDSGGADQLIGRGDMLYTSGNELVRVQCAFVDTPEVDNLTEFIGSQKAYPTAFELPEYTGEETEKTSVDLDDRDVLFDEAARVLVIAQQGSASLLQRKLKLGYNRAGRIIDQLESARIVGPFEGSKARQVLVPDLVTLEEVLTNL